MAQPRVLVVQTGGRHHYMVPAIMAEAGMLEAFYTDLCSGRGFGRIADLASRARSLGPLTQPMRNLAGRRPPDAVLRRTRTNDLRALWHEIAIRLFDSPQARANRMTSHAIGQGSRFSSWGLNGATHLYSMFGEGGQLLLDARARGIPVLSDIYIALSADRIERAEYQAYPDWGPLAAAPPSENLARRYDHTRHVLEATDLFVCPSAFVADDLVENWGVDRNATRIIPYALKDSWFDLQPQPRPGQVLFVGSAGRRKGIHYLAQAAALLDGASFTFRVAGDVTDQVRRQPAAARLEFLGRIARARIGKEFARADVFVLPTLAEGSATVIYEAMAAGLPVITTRAAGSVIRDGIDGTIVPERDPQAIATAIDRIVSDRDLRHSMSEAARRHARSYTWQAYGESLRALIRETPSPLLREGD